MSHRYGDRYYKIGNDRGAVWIHAESNPAWDEFPVYRWNGKTMVPEWAWEKQYKGKEGEFEHEHIREVHITVTAGKGGEGERKEKEDCDSKRNQGGIGGGGIRGLLRRIRACIRFDGGFRDDG